MLKRRTMALALAIAVASPATAFAFGGIGCTDLPEYDRAQGALEGMTGACDMSVEQARRIVAAQDGAAAGARPAGSALHRRHRHRRARTSGM